MLNRFCSIIVQNKNILMLLTALLYMLSLYATLSGNLLIFSLLFTAISIFLLIRNLLPIKYVIIWTLLFYFGVINTSLRLKDVDELLNLAPVNSEITGSIISIPKISDDKAKFFFNVDKIKIGSEERLFKNKKVLVTLNSITNKENLKIYNDVKLEGRLSAPFKAGNPSQFDYGNYLRNHNAYAVFYANTLVTLDSKKSIRCKFLQGINNYRERIISLHSRYLPSPNLEILGGIVFGDDAVSPTQEVKDSFVSSGLLHILAASGMNVAFIFGFFFWIFSRLKMNYKLNVVLGMIMIVLYSFMTGLGPSIIRATCMLLFVLVGKLIDRDAHSISLLSFVALLMLICNPLFINDVGFQLSFIVTFGILLMTPALVKSENNFVNYLIGIVAIPIIAQLWVIPMQIFYFNNISVYSIFANIMSVPVLGIISPCGFISVLLAGITPLSDFICKIFDLVLNPLITLLINISDFWGHLPSSTIQTSHPSILQIIIYYGILLCVSGLLYSNIREKYCKKLCLTLLIFVIAWVVTLIPVKNSNLEITTFDVGNADCFLIGILRIRHSK